jgi:hypothetical protein
MRLTYLVKFALLTLIMTFVSACGDSSTTVPAVSSPSVATASYKVEYIAVSASQEGKTAYKIRLTNKSDGSAVAGKAVSLAAKMAMTGMSHATPATALTDNGDGTYSGLIYYVMASVDASGASMGTWELKFTVDGESATFNPQVTMATGKVAKLKGVGDTIGTAMGMGTSPRTYQLFDDGISGSNIKLFVSAVDDAMMMQFPAVSGGATLHNAMGAAVPVAAITVEVSTDKTNWTALADGGNGVWTCSGYSMLAPGAKLYVRLTVNGEQKTTDGQVLATDGSNGYQSLTVSGI